MQNTTPGPSIELRMALGELNTTAGVAGTVTKNKHTPKTHYKFNSKPKTNTPQNQSKPKQIKSKHNRLNKKLISTKQHKTTI